MRRIVKQKWIKSGIVICVFWLIFITTFLLNRAYIRKNTDMISVLVAANKIPAYTIITEDMITIAKKPRSVVTKDTVLNIDQLKGYFYTEDLGFGQGDIIKLDRLSNSNNSSPSIGNLVKLNNENKMLIAINTNLVKSCASLVEPGAVVNAIVFIKGEDMSATDKVISPAEDPRLANLLVLDKKNAEAGQTADSGRDAIPAVITLVLDKTDLDVAKTLVEYNEIGSIYLLPVGFKGDTYLMSVNK